MICLVILHLVGLCLGNSGNVFSARGDISGFSCALGLSGEFYSVWQNYRNLPVEICVTQLMDEEEQQCRVGLGKYRKKSGQTLCPKCSRPWNNASVPKKCSCEYPLGGKFELSIPQLDPKMLTDQIASTRSNVAGRNIRTFVQIGEENKV